MIPMPLAADELLALSEDLRHGPYLMQPHVQLLDLDHRVLSDLSDRVTAGQVDFKLDGKVSTRTCSIELVDPSREIAIDGADVSDGALFYDKMISAGVRVKGPRVGRWVTIPVFCGPMTNAARAGWTAKVTAQGKERLATGMVWEPRNYVATSPKIATIRSLLEETGEDPDRILLPNLPGRLPKDISLGRTDRAWPPVVSIADSMSRQALYDGRGDFRIRAWPEDPVLTITDGTGGTILSHPEVTYDSWQGFNGVWVRGPLKRSGKRPSAVVWLPGNHPLSPMARRRGGVLFRQALVVENAKVRTDGEAREIAERHLRRLVRETVSVKVDVMPNWLLEPADVVAVQTPALGHLEQTLGEFSLPLTAGVPMSLGVVKHLQRPTRRRRSKVPPAPPARPRRPRSRRAA